MSRVLTSLDYEMELPVGTYHIVAYALKDDGSEFLACGYTFMVPCGLSVECTDHSLIDVPVTSGSAAENIDPGLCYADPGAFPPMPTP